MFCLKHFEFDSDKKKVLIIVLNLRKTLIIK